MNVITKPELATDDCIAFNKDDLGGMLLNLDQYYPCQSYSIMIRMGSKSQAYFKESGAP